MPELLQLMTETPESVAAAVAISDARASLASKIASELEAAINSRLKNIGIGSLRHGRRKPLFESKDGYLSIDIGRSAFDFTMQAAMSNVQDVAVGICLRAEDRDPSRTYADEIARLSKSLGASAEPPDCWLLWFEHVSDLDVDGLRTKISAALWSWAADRSENGLAERAIQAKATLNIAPEA